MFKIGNTDIKDVRIGETQVKKVYLGSNLVWERNKVDSDANSFITAAALTEQTHKNAVNYLVTELKAKGLWTKMIAVYPFVGGNANAHKFNLKNPQDTDAAFRLSFYNSVIHDSNGITNGWADTFVNSSNIESFDSLSVGIYARTSNDATHAWMADISANISNSDSSRLLLMIRYENGNGYFDMYNDNSNRISAGIPNPLGLFCINRNSDGFKLFRNGSVIGSNTNGRISSFADRIIISRPDYPTNKNYAFSFIGNGLTDTEAMDFYNIIQSYQILLGRQI